MRSRGACVPFESRLSGSSQRRVRRVLTGSSIGSLLLLVSAFSVSSARADDWPQWLGNQRDGIWRETGIVRDFGVEQPEIRWRAPVSGGYSGPAVAGQRVFVSDFTGKAAVAPDPDKRNTLQGVERLHCLSAEDGTLNWTHEYPCTYDISYPTGPRATPTVDGTYVYMLGAQGDLRCLNIDDGELIWSRNLPSEYETKAPIWGYAAHPLVVGDLLVCLAGGDGSAVVALGKLTGKEVWRALTTPDVGYSPPTLIEAGGTRQLLIWHSQSLSGLNPETGEQYWSHPLEPDYAMSIAPPTRLGDTLFVGGIKHKSLALRLDANAPDATVLWRGDMKRGIGPSHCPVVRDTQNGDFMYGVDRGGELRCIEIGTGKQMWTSYALMQSKRRSNSGTGFITPNGDRYFIFSETGELIIAKLTPEGYDEVSRTQPLLKATHDAFGRGVVWCPPAFAHGAMFVRNNEELIRVTLSE